MLRSENEQESHREKGDREDGDRYQIEYRAKEEEVGHLIVEEWKRERTSINFEAKDRLCISYSGIS